MSLTLNSGVVRQVSETMRMLVSPLLYPSATDWRLAVQEATRTLFGADQAMTIMSGAGDLVVSRDLDPTVVRNLHSWFDGFTDEGRLTLNDPVVNHWNDRRRALGLRTYSRDLINRTIDGRVLESPYVNEALFANRMRYWQGLYATGRANSDAILWVSYSKRDAEPFGEQAIPLLQLLVPAFQAGLDVLKRLESSAAALDATGQSMIVFDDAGTELHRTAAFGDISKRDPGCAAIVARAHAIARELAKALGRGKRPDRSIADVTAELSTLSGRYALRASLIPEQVFCAGDAIAVLVLSMTPTPIPDVHTLHARYGLTIREAEVAMRLAAGDTRDQIARRLGVSPHTARAHTEKVFQKLGVNTRSAVALHLLGGVSTKR